MTSLVQASRTSAAPAGTSPREARMSSSRTPGANSPCGVRLLLLRSGAGAAPGRVGTSRTGEPVAPRYWSLLCKAGLEPPVELLVSDASCPPSTGPAAGGSTRFGLSPTRIAIIRPCPLSPKASSTTLEQPTYTGQARTVYFLATVRDRRTPRQNCARANIAATLSSVLRKRSDKVRTMLHKSAMASSLSALSKACRSP